VEAWFGEAAVAGDALREVIASLEAMGLGGFVDLDLTIVRGLAYYTGPVFELFDAGRTLRAICGGGRYDQLLASVGGADLPALGFGMGDVVLTELLRERGLLPAARPAIDLFVAAPAPEERPAALALAHQLRDLGWRVEYALGHQHLGKQLKLADARGARLVLVLAEAERSREAVIVKDLGTGNQREVLLAELPAAITAALGAEPPA
jgi:histidyl-tRNA synthetase